MRRGELRGGDVWEPLAFSAILRSSGAGKRNAVPILFEINEFCEINEYSNKNRGQCSKTPFLPQNQDLDLERFCIIFVIGRRR